MNFNSPEYKKYRKAYVTQCTVEHLVGLLVADAFLAKLLLHLGLSDAMVGIISSFTSVAFVFQLLSVVLVQSRFSTKKMVVGMDMVSTLLYMLIYFLPFAPIPAEIRKVLVMAAVMVSLVAKNIISSLYFKWANAYVEDGVRASFSAKKECISLITGIVFSLIAGFAIDRFDSIGNTEGGLLFIACTLLILNIINFISFVLIKDEDVNSRKSMNVPIKEVLKHISGNKIYKRYLFIDVFVTTGTGMLTGFVGVYKIKELAFSLLAVQIVNICADFLRMGVSMPFARYSDKHGFAKGLLLANMLTVAAKVLLVFTAPATRFLIIPYSLLTVAAQAGIYQNSFNIGYTILPQKYMVQAMAIKQTVTGLMAFVAALAGGALLEYVQSSGNTFLGIPMYGQQLLALIALVTQIPGIYLINKYVVKPIEKAKEKGECVYSE